MANEFSESLSLALTNGEISETIKTGTVRSDQAAEGLHGTIVDVGTTAETILTGDLTTPGIVVMKNLEAEGGNYVEYGPDDTGIVVFGRINPGETHRFRLAGSVTLMAQANTAAVNLRVWIFEA